MGNIACSVWSKVGNTCKPSTGDSDYKDAMLKLAPIIYYRLGETCETFAYDEQSSYVSNYRDNPNLNRPSLLANDANGSIGTNLTNAKPGHLAIHSAIELNFTSPFTISFIYNLTSYTNYFQNLLILKGTTGQEPFVITLNQNSPGDDYHDIFFGSPNSWGQFGVKNNNISLNNEVFVTLTYNGNGPIVSNYILYINGEPQTTLTAPTIPTWINPTESLLPFHTTQPDYDPKVSGLFDEFALFDKVIDAFDAKNLYEKAFTTSTYARTVKSLAPVSYWRFGEKENSTTAIDEMGRYNITYAASSVLNQTGLLVGDNDACYNPKSGTSSAGVHSQLQIYGDLTIIWNLNLATYDALYSRIIISWSSGEAYANNVNYQLDISPTGQFLYMHEYNSGVNVNVSITANLQLNTDYHIAMVRTTANKTLKLFVNGVLITTKSYSTNQNGGYSNQCLVGYKVNGLLDELAVFNYVISDAAIIDLYQKSIGN